jgi:Flp pilus assembly protein TadD
MEAKYFEKAIPIFERSANSFVDVNLYNHLGYCYQAIGQLKQAENVFRFALNMVPNRLQAKYNLLKLLLVSNRLSEANDLCTIIINTKLKIVNPKTIEMIEEVKIIQKQLINKKTQRVPSF